LPTHIGRAGEPPYCVGREKELAHLRGLLQDAALGMGSVTILSGASGSGKSRLLQECAQIDAPVEKLRAWCSTAPLPGQDLRSQVRDLPALLKQRPVALLIDDVHLVTREDLKTLESLASMAQFQRLALVATTTAEDGDAARWFPSEARYQPIGPLGEDAIELLVRGLLKPHASIAGNLLREIVRTAQGNPRSAIELAQCAVRSPSPQALVAPSARAKLQEARGVLSPGAYDTLVLCSALGERFDERSIANISQRPKQAVVAALQEACDIGLLDEDGASRGVFFFRHAAVRKAAYLSMISPRRRLLHEQIAHSLTNGNGELADVALLGYQLDALENSKGAAAALAEAASRLAGRRDFTAAADAYERAAVRLDVGSRQWFDVAHELVECWEKIGKYAPVIQLVEAMRSRPEFREHPKAERTLGMLFFSYLNECDWDAARNVAEQMAIAQSDVANTAVRARLVLAYAYAHAGHRSKSTRLMRGIKVRALGNGESRWRHQLASLALDAQRKPLNVLLSRVDRAAELGRNVGVAAVAYAYTEGVELALCHGDLALAQKYSARAIDFTERNSRGPKLPHELVKNAARLNLYAGRLADARALLVSNLRWRDSGRYNEAYHAGIGVFVGLRASDPSMVDAYFDPSLLATAVAKADAELCGLLLPGFAEVMCARGMAGALRDALRTCVEREIVDLHLSVQLCAARYAAAEEFDRLERQVDAWLRATVAPIANAHAALVKATLARRRGKLVAAQSLAREAVARYGAAGWRLYEAMSLEMAGDLHNAARIYTSCGATADASRAALGQRRKVRRAPFGARLTLREREVAGLVARKRTDREIARALSISVRTVHHHVEAAFSKLGVARRAQLTEALLGGPSTYSAIAATAPR
jgi:DNA-binding CsgD family transcriptional regulator